jgi:CelD/BcsL family acetyltransferase involved in cellulose biosynthesis
VYLNTAGEGPGDTVCVEYNDLLAAPGKEADVAAALLQHLNTKSWNELLLNGIECGRAGAEAILDQCARAQYAVARETHRSYYVDLDDLRQRSASFADSLRQPARKHLRQYLRYCGELGDIAVRAAADVPEALRMLDELKTLHQARWAAKGMNGAFASPRFAAFHKALITRCFSTGSIQIIRVSAGPAIVGIIYGFVSRRVMYFYQSGINYELPSRISPGIVANACAIQHLLDIGLGQYDFLAGDAQYKRMLAFAHRELGWVAVRRRSWKFDLIEVVRTFKRRFRLTGEPDTGRTEQPPGTG